MYPQIRCLDSAPSLRGPAMDTLCALVQQLRRRYALFMPTVNKVLLRHGIQSVEYDQLISTHVMVSRAVGTALRVNWEEGMVGVRWLETGSHRARGLVSYVGGLINLSRH